MCFYVKFVFSAARFVCPDVTFNCVRAIGAAALIVEPLCNLLCKLKQILSQGRHHSKNTGVTDNTNQLGP
jgi:hypothetical protein